MFMRRLEEGGEKGVRDKGDKRLRIKDSSNKKIETRTNDNSTGFIKVKKIVRAEVSKDFSAEKFGFFEEHEFNKSEIVESADKRRNYSNKS
jgi:hypothetical protein